MWTKILILCAALIAAPSFAAVLIPSSMLPSLHEPYPIRPIKVIISQQPGGNHDISVRTVTGNIKDTAFSFVYEYRVGGANLLGTQELLRSKPDGYTILQGTSSIYTIPLMLKDNKFDIFRDFEPIIYASHTENVVVVHPSVPFHTMRQMITYYKRGKPMLYGFGGHTGASYLDIELLAQLSGIKTEPVNYQSVNNALLDVMGGRIDLVLMPVPNMLAGKGITSKFKMIATTGPKRSKYFDLPCVAESVPGYKSVMWLGYFAPKGTDPHRLDILEYVLRQSLADSATIQTLDRSGIGTTPMTREQFIEFITKDKAETENLIRSRHLQIK